MPRHRPKKNFDSIKTMVVTTTPQGTEKSLRYCLDCVRPHLHLICDGASEFRTHSCKLHLHAPDPTLATDDYKLIRAHLKHRLTNYGLVSGRPLTPAIKEHRGCVHSATPKYIVQGLEGLLTGAVYWRRCNGDYRNIEGNILTMTVREGAIEGGMEQTKMEELQKRDESSTKAGSSDQAETRDGDEEDEDEDYD